MDIDGLIEWIGQYSRYADGLISFIEKNFLWVILVTVGIFAYLIYNILA